MIETLGGMNPSPHLIIVPGSPLSGLIQETSHGPLEGEQFGLKVVVLQKCSGKVVSPVQMACSEIPHRYQ